MVPIEPVVRHFLLCDDVRPGPAQSQVVNVLGLRHLIDSESGFPLRWPLLCVYIQFTGARGPGTFELEISDGGNERVLYKGAFPVSLANNPLAVNSLRCRVRNCSFSEPGLYWVELRWNGKSLGFQSLILR